VSLAAAYIGLAEFLVKLLIVPTLVCLAVMLPIAAAAAALRPTLGRLWLTSKLRARYRAVTQANLCAAFAVIGNLLVVLMALPLLRVPPGSGIKPMGLVFFSLVINVALPALCRRIVRDADRPQGSKMILSAAILLCLTPFLGGMVLMHAIATLRNLQFG
jgi:hypothetical protein